MDPGNRVRRLCKQCGQRSPQHVGGLCRTCAREHGYTKTTFEVEAERVHRSKPPTVVHQIHPTRTVTIDHVDYDVIWDGTQPLRYS